MSSIAKIKITDDKETRHKIDQLVDTCNQITLCKWGLLIAKRMLVFVEEEFFDCEVIQEGFHIQEQRQLGLVRMYDVRQAGFKIHEIARMCKTDTAKYATRCAGQAVGIGHMREHAMVCSDYAIKTLNANHASMDDIQKERTWQYDTLKELQDTQESSLI